MTKTTASPASETAVLAAAEQLAHPFGGLTTPISAMIAVAWIEQHITTLLTEHGGHLRSACPDLTDFLEGSVGSLHFHSTWNPTLGQIFALQGREVATPVDHGAAWGLQLLAGSVTPTRWTAALSRPTPIMFGGVLIGTADRLSVASDGVEATVELGNGTDQQVIHRQPLSALETGELQISTAAELPAVFLDGIAAEFAHAVDDQMRSSLASGLALLNAGVPPYEEWARHVLRRVLALKTQPGRLLSGSRSDFPGLIHMSLPEEPRAIAESLVHEASHQYYHLALHLGRPVTGEDTQLYFSPAVRRPRRLDRLLLAFHAFANVAAAYFEMRQVQALPDDVCEREIARLTPMLEQLRQPMIGNPTLTPLGRALVQPLDRYLSSRGVLAAAPL